jgi:hypothetical protein
MTNDGQRTVYLVKAMQDSLKKGKVARQLLDFQRAAPAKAESAIDAGLQGRAAIFTQDLGETPKILTGIVVDSLAGMHFYKVQLDHGMPVVGCTALGSSSNALMGAKSLSTIVPTSRVWVLYHQSMEYGVIIGCEPDISVDARNKLSDFISLSSRNSNKVDDAHTFPTIMAKGSGVIDFSTDRPFDGTTVGEWGHITETGLRMFLDPFMLQMAVNESCGVFAFLFDNMLRLTGHNLQIRTSGSELEALNDQGEFTYIHGFTPYPWEHKGVLKHDTQPNVENTPEQAQIDTPWYSEREPIHDDQMPFHRVIHTQGYLGQGGQRRVQLPKSTAGIYRYGSEPEDLGPLVFSEDILLTGRYNLRSAKAISIAKHIPMANFKRMTRPETISAESGGADSETNYMFAGIQEWANNVAGSAQSIPSHEIRDELKASSVWAHPSGVPTFLIRAASIMDSHAFTFNMESNHAYFYHKSDWGTADEAGSPLRAGGKATFQPSINFTALATKQYLEPPKAITPETIDHRYDDNPEGVGGYYPNESSIDLLEDGGVVIADGFGSELRMTGGQIFLSAPGDIWLKSGRNTNVWSGQDTIVKAKNSVDITASDKDVRIKSEKNMQLLAGNAGIGGLLLESRGVEQYEFAPKLGEDVLSGGVVIKSSQAPAVVLGPSVYIRAGLDEGALGDITLDCNQGNGVYKTNAAFQEHFVRNGIWWWFCEGTGETVGAVTSSYEFLPTWCSIGGSCGINGHLAINGHKANKGWDLVVDGHYASTACDIRVYCLEGTSLGKTETFIQEATEERQSLLAGIGAEQYASQFTNYWYTANRPGDNETIENIGVSLRDSKQYLTEEFVLFEDRWQQLSRLAVPEDSAQPAGKWSENPVAIKATGGIETYPYPGKKPWKDDKNLIQPDLGFVTSDPLTGALHTAAVIRNDPASGSSNLKTGMPYRGMPGASPKESWSFMPVEESFALDGNYRVIISSEKASLEAGSPTIGPSTGGFEPPIVDPLDDFDPDEEDIGPGE